MGFQLGNLYVKKGEKVCGFLKLPFTEDELPVTVIYGQEEGHTVLVDGGIHNAEYVGIECVTGLAAKLQPEDIKGILILLHIVNVNGFLHAVLHAGENTADIGFSYGTGS